MGLNKDLLELLISSLGLINWPIPEKIVSIQKIYFRLIRLQGKPIIYNTFPKSETKHDIYFNLQSEIKTPNKKNKMVSKKYISDLIKWINLWCHILFWGFYLIFTIVTVIFWQSMLYFYLLLTITYYVCQNWK